MASTPNVPASPQQPTTPSTVNTRSRITNGLRNQYATLLGGAGIGYGAKALNIDATSAVNALPSAVSVNGVLTNLAAPAIVGHAAGKMFHDPNWKAGAQLGVTAAAALAPSYVTVPLATGLAGYWAGNKAVQWSGLSRDAYASMDGPGYWNFTKRNITSTPGKLAMGMFWSGWQPKLHNDLRWQERIGAAAPQAMRGLVRSFYTPWNSPKPDHPELGLQGFEKLPGLFIRPVVSAVHTLWNKLPGTSMFNSPDEFGKGVANIAWSPVTAASWLAKAPGRFWKYAWSDPDAKK